MADFQSTFGKAFGIVLAIILGIFIFRSCGWLFWV